MRCILTQKKITKCIFTIVTYLATPLDTGHDIYNFGRLFLGHHYYTLGLFGQCLGVEKKLFEETMHFHHMTYNVYGHALAQ